jgi:predicted Zn-dependent protease
MWFSQFKLVKYKRATLLRKLGNYSRKNLLYQAFQELRRVRRTVFLLQYISDIQLRRNITAVTNIVVDQQREQKNADAHYYIGRALLESDRDFARSVSELRQAKQTDPENPAIYYYLGRAIRALVEQETLVEAENAFQNYLNAGTPLGQEEEVRQFLKSREKYIR